MDSLRSVPCRLCGASPAEGEPRYASMQDAGAPLGRFEVRLVQCGRCGLIQVSPRPSPAAQAAHYRGGASATPAGAASEPGPSAASGAVFRETGAGSRHAALAGRRVRFVRAAIERYSAPGARSLLEVGCGRGDLLGELAPDGWRAVGLEPSSAAAAIARAAGLCVVEETLEASAPTLSSTERFDVVCAFSVLEHLDDPGLAADRLAELCGDQGVLVLEVPDSLAPRAQVSEFFTFEHLTHFTPHTLASLFAARGLGLVALERHREQSGLAAVFRRGAATVHPPDDRAEVAAAIDRYAQERRELEREVARRLELGLTRWRAAEARVGVYGAGVHTRFLFDLAPLREVACCVLDGDARKQGGTFQGLPVYSPDAVRELELDAVVLSSRAFEDEMAARLGPFAGAGGEVVRLYA